ncbi:hypothetical protein BGZ52_010524 [Haplosporangium bisporale]|nr:hypothetical protein BGZ52_010524 [Haplosporangium bisporale]
MQIPRERILLGKRVLSFMQNKANVVIECSDNSTYYGDILVGADVCWMVILFLEKDSAKRNDSFRNSEWGFEEAEALAREVRPFKVPGGKDGKAITLGMYVDKTPRQQMSKVMLEEIVFKTWYGGRTVLLGDGTYRFFYAALSMKVRLI